MAAPRKPPNAGKGRKPGVPNKVTREVREAIKLALEKNVDKLGRWFDKVGKDDPARALAIYGHLAEFVTPKLQRVERGIPDATDEELLQEIRRRRAAAEAEEAAPPGAVQP